MQGEADARSRILNFTCKYWAAMQLYFIQSVTFRTSKQKHGQEKKIIIIAIYTIHYPTRGLLRRSFHFYHRRCRVCQCSRKRLKLSVKYCVWKKVSQSFSAILRIVREVCDKVNGHLTHKMKIEFRDLSYNAPSGYGCGAQTRKKILKSINGEFRSCELTAVSWHMDLTLIK